MEAPAEPQSRDLATQLALGVNLLLDRLGSRAEGMAAQLNQAETRFSKAFRSSPAAISIASLPDGRWLEINDALEKMTGYSRGEALGRTSAELGIVDAAARDKILQAVREQGFVRNVELQIRTKSGQMVDALVSVEEVQMDGQPCALTIQYDITDLKRAERDIRRLNHDLKRGQTALEEANKELEAFSYSVAHDLRAPLRSVEKFSELIVNQYREKLDEQGRKYLKYVRDSATRMGQLIDDMLVLARVTRSELGRAPVDLGAMAKAVMERFRIGDPDREIDLAIADGVTAKGDARLLGIVLENLLGNAWKFTAKVPSARIGFGMLPPGDGSRVYFVSDNGAGFDMAYAHRLFGVFQRLHPAGDFEGTGIGLVTVQRVVSRHGGRIWAEGKVDHGATFFFTLGEEKAGP